MPLMDVKVAVAEVHATRPKERRDWGRSLVARRTKRGCRRERIFGHRSNAFGQSAVRRSGNAIESTRRSGDEGWRGRQGGRGVESFRCESYVENLAATSFNAGRGVCESMEEANTAVNETGSTAGHVDAAVWQDGRASGRANRGRVVHCASLIIVHTRTDTLESMGLSWRSGDSDSLRRCGRDIACESESKPCVGIRNVQYRVAEKVYRGALAFQHVWTMIIRGANKLFGLFGSVRGDVLSDRPVAAIEVGSRSVVVIVLRYGEMM